MRTWLVTGAARGLGYEIARHALGAGDRVVATARDRDEVRAAFSSLDALGERLLTAELDVTDARQVAAATDAVTTRFGAVDVLVNNAGRGLVGAVEEASNDEVHAVFEANVFGLLTVTRAVLPQMRAAGAGSIVNIGSMGGFAQVPGWGVYGATKFAVEGLSEAMRAELAPLGINVTVVEPGSFRTGFLGTSSLHAAAAEIDDYAPTAGEVRRATALANGGQVNDPAKGAAAIYEAVTSPYPPARLQLGPDAIAMVEAKLAFVREELETWRDLGSSTLFDPPGDSPPTSVPS